MISNGVDETLGLVAFRKINRIQCTVAPKLTKTKLDGLLML